MPDWNSDLYTRFAAPRLRPAMDLLAQTGPLVEGTINIFGWQVRNVLRAGRCVQ